MQRNGRAREKAFVSLRIGPSLNEVCLPQSGIEFPLEWEAQGSDHLLFFRLFHHRLDENGTREWEVFSLCLLPFP